MESDPQSTDRPHGHSRRAPSHDALSLRPASRSRRTSSGCGRRRTAARRSSATRSTSRRSRISSTGSRIRTAITWRARVPGEDARAARRVDLVAEMSVFNPFDFFLEPSAETVPVRLRALAAAGAGAVPRASSADGPRLREFVRTDRSAPAYGRSISSSISTRRCRRRSRTSSGSSRACRRRRRRCAADAARAATRAGCWCRSLRHLGLAARFVSGYLIQLDARREVARRAERRRRRLHRSARVGGGVSARRRLDRARSDLRPARRRRPHPARRDARPVSAAPITGALDECEVDVRRTRCTCGGSTNRRA